MLHVKPSQLHRDQLIHSDTEYQSLFDGSEHLLLSDIDPIHHGGGMTDATAASSAPINSIVAMIRVSDVMNSAKFYRHLGFQIGNAVPREGPPFNWAWLYQPNAPNWKTGANLMLVSGNPPGITERAAKTVLFYLYASNMKSLREELLAKGFTVSEISYPSYLPEGEFRVEDPDGYTLMIAQSGQDTP